VKRVLIWAGAGVLALSVAGWLVLRSEWLRTELRRRAIAETERVTGGRVEMTGFDFEPRTWTARATGVTLRGNEPGEAAPLLRLESGEVALTVRSLLRREVDVAAVRLRGPRVHVVVNADGSTNIPGPRRAAGESVTQLIRLAAGRVVVEGGEIAIGGRTASLNLDLKDVRLDARFAEQAYLGSVSVGSAAWAGKVQAEVRTEFRVDAGGVRLTAARGSALGMDVRGTAAMTNWAEPVWTADLLMEGDLARSAEWLRLLGAARLPGALAGQVRFEGSGRWASGRGEMQGALNVLKGSLAVPGRTSQGFTLNARAQVAESGAVLDDVEVRALGGVFSGSMQAPGWRRFALAGELRGLTLGALAAVTPAGRVPVDGTLAGTVEASGGLNGNGVTVAGSLSLAPLPDVRGMTGRVAFQYDGDAANLQLLPSHFQTAHTRVNLSGAPGKLAVFAQTSNLAELASFAGLASPAGRAGDEVALLEGVELRDGSAALEGVLAGGWPEGHFSGTGRVTSLARGRFRVDRGSCRIEARRGSVTLSEIAVQANGMTLAGRAELALDGWTLSRTTPVTASLRFEGVTPGFALPDAAESVKGTFAGEATLTGNANAPRVAGRTRSAKVEIGGQVLDDLAAHFEFDGGKLTVMGGEARAGGTPLRFEGIFQPDPGSERTGTLRVAASARAIPARAIRGLPLDGAVSFDGAVAGRFSGRTFSIGGAHGNVSLEGVTFDGNPLGSLRLDATTEGGFIHMKAGGMLRNSPVSGAGRWPLDGRAGEALFQLSRLDMAALAPLLWKEAKTPVAGHVTAQMRVTGSLKDVSTMRAALDVPEFDLIARQGEREFRLRNDGTLEFALDARHAAIRRARLVAPNTDIEAEGSVAFERANPLNLRLRGAVNMAILNSFRPDLNAAGISTVDAVVRGTLAEPSITGNMKLRDAAFSLRDVPNGLERVNGDVVFDSTRANLSSLRAQSGGGDLTLTGFIGFRGPLTYHLQAAASRVRVRYPEGVSTVADASLSLTGTAARSLLAGSVTVVRTSFGSEVDLGGLIAKQVQAAATTPVVTNEFLRDLQFDVRVETAANAEISTSLTRDVQAELDLRVRGTVARPVVLGRISVLQGEIQFYGGRYTISRGEVSLLNPVRIEPVIDLDLETRVRGVTVNINFTGPANRINMTYRSDPPLQSQEILALLAAGRTPTGVEGIGPSPSIATGSAWQNSANSVLSSLATQPVTSRLQRLFGVSNIRIDPQLVGLENTPQARLTVEQQVSRDITLTFVTNLSKAQQQVVRAQWDFSRNWSAVAVRDENGLFGLDFYFRKRFK